MRNSAFCTLTVTACLLWALPAASQTLAAAATADSAAAQPGYAELIADLQVVGQGTLRWAGIRIYDAVLRAPQKPVVMERPLSLSITYRQSVDAIGLKNTTITELGRFSSSGGATIERWSQALGRIFPAVSPGDELTAVWQPGAAQTAFFLNAKPIGQVTDREFGQAFFAIWLDERTRRPELRKQLLALR
jgi:hypothetical protein